MDQKGSGRGGLGARSGIALAGFVAILGVLLLTEHRAHVLGALPYLLLLACPLLHVFHHHGHADHSKEEGAPQHNPTRTHDTHGPTQGGAK